MMPLTMMSEMGYNEILSAILMNLSSRCPNRFVLSCECRRRWKIRLTRLLGASFSCRSHELSLNSRLMLFPSNNARDVARPWRNSLMRVCKSAHGS